jgi:hypothetical protein
MDNKKADWNHPSAESRSEKNFGGLAIMIDKDWMKIQALSI